MLEELSNVLRYGPNGLSEASFLVFVVIGIMCTVALGLLYTAWRSTKHKAHLVENGYKYLEYEYKVKIRTQRNRYVKVFTAWVLSGIPLVWVAMHSVDVYYVMDDAFAQQGTAVGLIVNVCGYMPSILLAFCLSLVVRVNLTPAAFRKRYLFRKNKGNYVLTSPEHRRFGIARHEFVNN